jgi:hypothetical protein
MNEQDLETKARELLARVLKDAPEGYRLVQRDLVVDNYPNSFRSMSDHFFSVLNPGTDLVVFFDTQGNVTGWRDDGRKGAQMTIPIHREGLLEAIRSELELTKEAWLGEVKLVVLPPTGWTHHAVVFTKKIPGDDDILRVWVDPLTKRIIQCLYGAAK